MDAWPIGYKPSPPKKTTDVKEDVKRKKRQQDYTYDSAKRVRAFQVSWKIGRAWLDLAEGSMFCNVCRANVHQHAEKGSFTAGTHSFQLTSVRAHEQTTSHKRECLAVAAALKPAMESTAGEMLLALNRALTEKLKLKFRTVHALAKHDRPFTDYVWHCNVDELKGLQVGSDYRNDKAAADFAHHIAEVRQQVKLKVR